jgi:hypothetical protein
VGCWGFLTLSGRGRSRETESLVIPAFSKEIRPATVSTSPLHTCRKPTWVYSSKGKFDTMQNIVIGKVQKFLGMSRRAGGAGTADVHLHK